MTIVAGSDIEIQLRQVLGQQQIMNVFGYRVNTVTLVPDAVQIAEAWWAHVKTSTRALQTSAAGDTFFTVAIREMNNPEGDYAEFDIPTGERVGTRTPPTQGNQLPLFNAAAIRLTVGTRATRPGQKRLAFLTEEDNNAGSLQTAMKALLVTWAGVITSDMTLGSPAAGTVLQPRVFRKDINGNVTASQAITGFVVANNITSQVSRKYGRGI